MSTPFQQNDCSFLIVGSTGPLVKNERSLYLRSMPRVTEQYRASRRAEIVAAAAQLFAVNGFHATSMADIISASGLSAGAVYRYFRSKEELIGAVAETALSTADEVFESLLADGAAPSPEQALTAIIQAVIDRIVHEPTMGVDLTRIGVQVWAEALRSPDLAARADEVTRRLRGHFAEVARRWQAAGQLPADAVPDQVGAAMLGLVQGFALQRLLLSGTNADSYLAGVKALLSTTSPTGALGPVAPPAASTL
jgi:AcrR family transcriptional regulator